MIENPMAVSAGAESAPSSIELAPYANAVGGGAHVASTPEDGSDRRTVAVAVAFSTSTKSRDRAKGFPALSSQRSRQLDPACLPSPSQSFSLPSLSSLSVASFGSSAAAAVSGLRANSTNRLLTFLVFLCLSAVCLGVLLGTDVALAVPNYGAFPAERLWHRAPRIQALFYIAVVFVCSELAIRFGRRDLKYKPKRFYLAVFWLLFVPLFLAVPNVSYERLLAPLQAPVGRGNCTDPGRNFGDGDRETLRGACPAFDDRALFKIADGFLARARAQVDPKKVQDQRLVDRLGVMLPSGISMGMVQFIKQLATLRTASRFLPDVLGQNADMPSHQRVFFSSDCYDRYADLLCEVSLSRCAFSDCQEHPLHRPLSNASCTQTYVLENWIFCAQEACAAGHDNNEGCEVDRVDESALQGAISFSLEAMQGDVIKSLFGPPERFVVSVLGGYMYDLVRSRQNKTSSGGTVPVADTTTTGIPSLQESRCSILWKDTTTTNDNNNDKKEAGAATSMTCDPAINTYTVSNGSPLYYDCAPVMYGIGFPVACLYTLAKGTGKPRLVIFSWRERVGRSLSLFLGLLSAVFVFVAGINLERVILKKGGNANVVIFSWSPIYMMVALWSLHHAINYLLLPAKKRRPLVPRRPETLPRRRRVNIKIWLETTAAAVSRGNEFKSALKRLYRRWYLEIFVVREIVETGVQLAGLFSIALVGDAEVVLRWAWILGLNMITLTPLAVVSVWLYGSRTAVGVAVITEKIFDAVFVVSSVLARSDNTDNTVHTEYLTVWEQLARHLPTLVPAFAVLFSKQTRLISIAQDLDRREQTHKLWAAKTLQHWWRKSQRIARARAWAGTTRPSPGRVPGPGRRRCRGAVTANYKGRKRLPPTWVQKTRRRCGGKKKLLKTVLVGVFTLVAFVTGMSLLTYSSKWINYQHALCADAIGGIARCAKPRLYTRHGFFEAYDCGWAQVEAFECADQDLAQDEHSRHGELPGGTGDVWASMTALRRIDVSGNDLKGSLPPLWGNIPDLHDLDASDNPGLSDLPFRICAGSSADTLQTINLEGTEASRRLNWDGQVAPFLPNSTSCGRDGIGGGCGDVAASVKFSQACMVALRHSLTSLSLRDNGLTCPCAHLDNQKKAFVSAVGEVCRGQNDASADAGDCNFYPIVRDLRAVSNLDLGGRNDIRRVDEPLIRACQRGVSVATESVNLSGNPLQLVLLKSVPSTTAAAWARMVVRDAPPQGLRYVRLFTVSGDLHNTLRSLDVKIPSLDVEGCNLTAAAITAAATGEGMFARIRGLVQLGVSTSVFPARLHRNMLELSASSRLTMRELSLHLCGIHAVESGAISLWMPHLRDLSFTHNSLDAVPGDVLIGLPELERLSFGRNPVSQGWLDARPFASAQLSLLRYLDFSPPAVMQSQEDGEEEKGRSASATVESDEVVAIRRGTFAGLSGLEDLSVHGFARLSRVEEGVWDNLPGLRRLKLDGNNISRAFSLANDSWVGEGAALLNLTQLEFLDMSQKKGAGNPLSQEAVERAVAGLPSGCYYYTRYGPGRVPENKSPEPPQR